MSVEHSATHGTHSHEHVHDHHHDDDGCCAIPEYQAAKPILQAAAGQQLTRLRIEQMDCPVEEQLIRKRLSGQSQVVSLQFNLMQRELDVLHSEGYQEKLIKEINALGMQPVLIDATDSSSKAQTVVLAASSKKELGRISASVVLALVAEVGSWLGWSAWLVIPLAILALVLTGGVVYKKGLIALKNRNLNINALMSIAVTGAVLLGEWPEAAMVMSLFALAEYIEAKSLDRARHAVDGLLALTPDEVAVLDETGQWQQQPATQVLANSLVKVLPGGRIGLDGVVEQGRSSVNQASITGESLPLEKTVGDVLYAGTINGMGELQYRTNGRYDDSLLARIAISVQQAQQSKAPVQRFVDQFSQIYTPIVTAMALALAVLGPLFFGGTWFDWIYKALVLLVIACPCALVISTPVAVVSALATAAKAGLLVKGGLHLERARQLDYLAVDKTGTITAGMPTLQGQWVADEINSAELDQETILRAGYALAIRSDHPASIALAQYPSPQMMSDVALLTPTEFTAMAGSGVTALINGENWRLGKLNWVLETPGLKDKSFAVWQESWQEKGASFVFLAKENQLLAAFAVADQIKEGVVTAIADLQQMGVQVEMLSGDNNYAVKHVADQVGIKYAQGELLPTDKLRIITERTQQHRCSGMVGDGINDAPALAKADIGFAMGVLGSDMAIETADVAIMNDDLAKIPYTMHLSTALHHILIQNISAALVIKAVFLVMAVLGMATMWMAVFADVGASLLVILNSLRLLKKRSMPEDL